MKKLALSVRRFFHMTKTDYLSLEALSETLVKDLYARLALEIVLVSLFAIIGEPELALIWFCVVVPGEFSEVWLHRSLLKTNRAGWPHIIWQFAISIWGGFAWGGGGIYLWATGNPLLMAAGLSMVVGLIMHVTFKYSDWSKGALVGAIPPAVTLFVMTFVTPEGVGHWGHKALLIFGFAGLIYYTFTISRANILKQEQLTKALSDASAANQSKSAFLANMSHEIRTPMNGVLGMADLMGRTDLSPQQAEMVSIIQASGDTLLRIIDDVLDLSKIEAGHLSLEAAPFDLREVVRTIVVTSELVAREKHLAFSCEYEADGQYFFIGDALRLRQVIGNLVSNAIKFTSTGGVKLELETRSVENRSDYQVVVRVIDSGYGLSAEEMEEIFNPFVQVDDSMSRRHGGTGLGLSIARDITRAMNGKLQVESEVGKGSVFTFTCFLAPADMPGMVRETEPQEEGFPTKEASRAHILVAEDHPFNRRVLELMLENIDVDVTYVEDGEQAVEACAQTSFDLILMDIQMPGLSGVEALSRIRVTETSRGRKRTPMIALTANAMKHQMDAYIEAGFDGFLAKPFSFEALWNVMSEVLSTPAE